MSARKKAIDIEKQFKGLSEDTIKSQFSTTPLNVLKIVRIGVTTSVRGNIFAEWPLGHELNTKFNAECLEFWEKL